MYTVGELTESCSFICKPVYKNEVMEYSSYTFEPIAQKFEISARRLKDVLNKC